MKIRPLARLLIAASALALVAPPAFAQERPDFSGTWVADQAASSGTAKPAAPVLGPHITIDHKGSNFTLVRTYPTGPATFKYVLDGSETSLRMPARLCMADSGSTWTAGWEGPGVTLALIGVTPPNGKPVKADVRTTLRAEGPDALRVEIKAQVAGSPTPRVSSTLYKRVVGGSVGSNPSATPPARATIAQVAWISGVWVGQRGESTVEERWTPPAAGSMMATSRTLRDGVVSEFEFLCIVERDGGLVYQAMPNGRSPATDFTLTSVSADEAVFENPAHDFPKKVRYARRPDGSLEAVVSGDAGSTPLTFVFKRQAVEAPGPNDRK
jgi:hypothetical protein